MSNRAAVVLIAGAVGFGLGIAVTLAIGGLGATSPGGGDHALAPMSTTPDTEITASPPPRSAPSPGATPRVSSPDHADVDVDALLAELEFLRSMIDPLSGPPVEWPQVDAYAPESVLAAAEAAFPDLDVAVDCREFPCVAVIESGTSVPESLSEDVSKNGYPKEGFGRLGGELERTGLDGMQLAVRNERLDDGRYRILAAWLTPEEDAEVGDRLGARLEHLAEHGVVGREP